EVMVSGDLPNLHILFPLVDQRKYAIIGSNEFVSHAAGQQGAARCSHPRVHHNQVDRIGRKEAIALGQREGSVENIVGGHLVGDVHDFDVGIDVVDDPFHRADEVVAGIEVRNQGNDRLASQ